MIDQGSLVPLIVAAFFSGLILVYKMLEKRKRAISYKPAPTPEQILRNNKFGHDLQTRHNSGLDIEAYVRKHGQSATTRR